MRRKSTAQTSLRMGKSNDSMLIQRRKRRQQQEIGVEFVSIS
jgi:hypothetical protein